MNPLARYRGRAAVSLLALAAAMLLLALAGRTLAGFVPGLAPPEATPSTLAADLVGTPLPAGTQPNGKLRIVRLEAGPASAGYPVEAPNPATHTVRVTIDSAADADVSFWLEPGAATAFAEVSLSDASIRSDRCQQLREWLTCDMEFEAGLGPPGYWTMHIVKRSPAPSLVYVTVTFRPVQ